MSFRLSEPRRNEVANANTFIFFLFLRGQGMGLLH
jgi:hypothetical protein